MNDSEILNRLGIEVSQMQSDIIGLTLNNENLKERVNSLEKDLEEVESKTDIEIPGRKLKEIKLEVRYYINKEHVHVSISPKQVEEMKNLGVDLSMTVEEIKYKDKEDTGMTRKELKEIELDVEYLFSDTGGIYARISSEQVEEIETFGIDLSIKTKQRQEEKFMKSLSRLGHLKIFYNEKNEEFVKSIVGVYRMLRKEEIDHLLNNGIKIEIVS